MSQGSRTPGDLAHADAMLRALVDHTPGFAAVLDGDMRIAFVSPSVTLGLGWTAEELMGRPALELLHPDDLPMTIESLQRQVGIAGQTPTLALRVRCKDGTYRWVEGVANNMLDDPDVRGIVVNAHDVTDRKSAEAMFRAAFESSAIGMALADAHGRIVEANAALHEMLGYPTDELRGRSYLDITHPDDVELDRPLANELIAGERASYTLEKRYLRRDGSTAWGRLTVSLLAETARGGGRIALALVEDITQRRSTEEALRRATERYRMLVEHLPAVTYVWEADLGDRAPASPWLEDGPVYYTSPQIERLLGFTVEEWETDPFFWRSRLHPDDREAVLDATQASKREGTPFRMEYRYLRKDGEVVWVLDEATPVVWTDDGRPWLFQGVMIDITERKAAEDDVRRTTESLRTVLDSSPVAITAIDLDGTVRSWNPAAERMFGWSEEEVLGSFLPQVGPDDRASFERLRDRVVGEGRAFERVEVTRRRRDGTRIDLEVSYAPLRDRVGVITGMIAIQKDITEEKRARAKAAEAEERYRTLVEQIPAITFVDEIVQVDEDVEFRTVYVSPQVDTMLGYDRDRYAVDRLWPTILHPLDAHDVLRIAAEHVARRTPIDLEYRVVTADGRTVWVREQSMPLPQPDGRLYWQGVLYDVTTMKQTEHVLRDSEAELRRSLDLLRRTDEERRRLLAHLVTAENAERGRMAEDIEDDSLQHITAVGIRLGTLRQRLTDPEQLGAVDRLAETVQQALGRLRSVLVELRPRALEQDGLADALRQFARVTTDERSIDVDVEDHLDSQPDLDVRTLAYRIAQEAIANAVEWSDGTRVLVVIEERNGGVAVRVEDDGKGFDVERIDASTAVGVSAMSERAELAGGWLRIRSTPGRGTVVEFWLPGTLTDAP